MGSGLIDGSGRTKSKKRLFPEREAVSSPSVRSEGGLKKLGGSSNRVGVPLIIHLGRSVGRSAGERLITLVTHGHSLIEIRHAAVIAKQYETEVFRNCVNPRPPPLRLCRI